jgi:hypothetical protein
MPPLQDDETRTEQNGYDPGEYNEGYTEEQHNESNSYITEPIEEDTNLDGDEDFLWEYGGPTFWS